MKKIIMNNMLLPLLCHPPPPSIANGKDMDSSLVAGRGLHYLAAEYILTTAKKLGLL
jgi:hypothetical protein